MKLIPSRKSLALTALLLMPSLVYACSPQNNDVYISYPTSGDANIASISFEVQAKDKSIPSGQTDCDHETLPRNYTFGNGSNGKVTFVEGRHGDSNVASDFVQVTAADPLHSWKSINTFDHNPGALNFAFWGDMHISLYGGQLTSTKAFTLKDVAIAQGHWGGTTNNWWFGGKHCKYIGNNRLQCPAEPDAPAGPGASSVTVTFQRGGNNINQITITDIRFNNPSSSKR